MEHRNSEISSYFQQYGSVKSERLDGIRNLIHEVVPSINEKMWSKVPCFFIDMKICLIRAFGNHINICLDVKKYKAELKDFQITPKGFLKILDNQDVPKEVLSKIFAEFFNKT